MIIEYNNLKKKGYDHYTICHKLGLNYNERKSLEAEINSNRTNPKVISPSVLIGSIGLILVTMITACA